MLRLGLIILFTGVLVGCGLTAERQQERLAKIKACRDAGYTPYVGALNYMEHCVSPKEQAKLERLELACVSAGGTVDYDSYGKYRNCQGKPAVQINNNAGSSGFKPYCPPGSQGKVYGC